MNNLETYECDVLRIQMYCLKTTGRTKWESCHSEVRACCNMLLTEMKYSGNHIQNPPV